MPISLTGSLNISGSNTLIGTKTITGSVFISGSKTVIGTNTITGSMLISGSLTAVGTITATTLVVQTITSSISSITGSTNFGSLSSNTHTFTGSINASGSGNFSGSLTVGGFGTSNFSSAGTGYNKVVIRNTTAGVANGSQLSIGTDADPDQLYIQSFATTFTTNGMNVAGGAVINGEGPGGLNLAATQAGIGFYTNGSAAANLRMTISSAGNVGINSSSPSQRLEVSGNGFFSGVNNGALFGEANCGITGDSATLNAANMRFYTGNTERMRITSGGNVLIGTTTDRSFKLVVEGTDNNNLMGSYNTTSGTSLRMQSNQTINYIVSATNQLQFEIGGAIRTVMRTDGNVAIGDTGDANQRLRVVGSSTGTSAYGIVVANSTGASTMLVRNDGYGYLLASAWAYGSDFRMKENVSDVENGLNMVLKMKPKHFDYINGQKDNLGFIAQDIQEIIPQAVSISDETTGMLALKTDFLIPYLVKAIQELTARVQYLENK